MEGIINTLRMKEVTLREEIRVAKCQAGSAENLAEDLQAQVDKASTQEEKAGILGTHQTLAEHGASQSFAVEALEKSLAECLKAVEQLEAGQRAKQIADYNRQNDI